MGVTVKVGKKWQKLWGMGEYKAVLLSLSGNLVGFAVSKTRGPKRFAKSHLKYLDNSASKC